jgi:hypothetical protein
MENIHKGSSKNNNYLAQSAKHDLEVRYYIHYDNYNFSKFDYAIAASLIY